MTNQDNSLREEIYNISLTPINDIYYVPPGTDGSVGLSAEKIDQILALFTKELSTRVAEAELNAQKEEI